MSPELILLKFQGCLAGVQIGGALGRKSEGLTKEEIIDAMELGKELYEMVVNNKLTFRKENANVQAGQRQLLSSS